MSRSFTGFALASGLLLTLPSLAFAQPQPQPAPAAPAAPAAAADPNAQQYSINQNVGDWVVRCVQTTVKSPAPCEILQTTVNTENKQRISAFSIAYIPSREAYAMQIVVPTGVALAKGLTLEPSLKGARFTRCERDGCYAELLIDNNIITSLGGAGKQATIKVSGYGPQGKEIPLPVSLTGFPEAMDRMKTFSKERAVALPANTPVLPTSPNATVQQPSAAAPAAPPTAAPARGAKTR